MDSKIIDGTFETLSCPVCETAFCTFPCIEKLASRNKKCPVCKKFEMSRLAEIIKNVTYRARLEELKVSQRVSDQVYDKLRLEYEIRQREAISQVYAKSPEREAETTYANQHSAFRVERRCCKIVCSASFVDPGNQDHIDKYPTTPFPNEAQSND